MCIVKKLYVVQLYKNIFIVHSKKSNNHDD